ncbi:PIR protein [Plasmodium vivax]|nr:PIR protein [Plasmodium vivax]
MSTGMEYTLDKIKNEYISIRNSTFYKMFQEFDKSCVNTYYDAGDSCYYVGFEGSSLSVNVISLLKKLYSNLYRVYVSSETVNNDYFPDYLDEVEKIGCICLKYWLYDQIVSRGLSESETKILFNGYQNYINGKTQYIPKDYCNFSELSLNHINTLKNIYALYTIFYNNTNISEACNNDKCKYMDYFGKGLDDFINSIKRCTSNSPNDNYCNEFNEFIKMCKTNSEYAGILIYDVPVQSTAGTKGKYLLSSEKYQNGSLYIYLKDKNMLNLLKTSDFLSNKKSTIAATSVVASAIGLPSIFYYLYKFTPFGSALRRGNGKNIENIDKEEPNDLLYTAFDKQTPYESRNYNVAYHTFNDTEP